MAVSRAEQTAARLAHTGDIAIGTPYTGASEPSWTIRSDAQSPAVRNDSRAPIISIAALEQTFSPHNRIAVPPLDPAPATAE